MASLREEVDPRETRQPAFVPPARERLSALSTFRQFVSRFVGPCGFLQGPSHSLAPCDHPPVRPCVALSPPLKLCH